MLFLYAIGAIALLLLVLDRLPLATDMPWWGQLLSGGAVGYGVVYVGHGPWYSVPAALFFAVSLLSVQKALATYSTNYRPRPPRVSGTGVR